MKKFYAVLFTFALLVVFNSCNSPKSGPAAAASDSGLNSINTKSYFPLVNDGTPKITLNVLAFDSWLTSSDTIMNAWAWQYFNNKMGVTFHVNAIDDTTLADRINLMFGSGDLPDMLISCKLTTSQLEQYGAGTGQLAKLEPYINSTLTPGIYDAFNVYPNARRDCTATDNSIYTLPFIYAGGTADPSAADNFAVYRSFINQTWLTKCGLENPTTINDLINVLKTFKAKDPAGVGPNNVVPFGTTYGLNTQLFRPLFYSAYGIQCSNAVYNGSAGAVGANPAGPAIDRNGKAIMPALDNSYLQYLTFMNTCYTQGLISPDYFTMTSAQMRAMVAENRCGVITDWADYLSVPDTWSEWTALNPLTVDQSATPAAVRGMGYQIGGFAMSAQTKYPEVCIRFIDYLFTPEGYWYTYSGPVNTQTDILYGVKGVMYDPATNSLTSQQVIDGTNTSLYDYQTTKIYPFSQVIGRLDGSKEFGWSLLNKTYPAFTWDKISTDPDLHYRYGMSNATKNYLVDGYPTYVYMTAEDSQQYMDLMSTISDYITAQEAKFITGARPLGDFNTFCTELKNMGIDKLLALQAKAIGQ